jgi:D-sedoheptulose 7-phosphate isomerase
MSNVFSTETIRDRVRESITLKQSLLDDALVASLAEVADMIIDSARAGGKVVLFGNGGSAADATHLAAEFVGRFKFNRDPLPALSLSDNGSSVTAIGNDYSYDVTFSRQLKALGQAGDVAIGISTSGSSPNVVEALRTAQEVGMQTVSFTGARGFKMAAFSDISIMIPSLDTARVQEGYMLYAHIMCELVEREIFGAQRALERVAA